MDRTPRNRLFTTFLFVSLMAGLLAIPAASDAQDQERETHSFWIAIVSARPGPAAMPDLPEDAERALTDVANLLPYSAFELIDTGWIRTLFSGNTRLGDAGAFEISLHFEPTSDPMSLFVEGFRVDYREYRRQDDVVVRSDVTMNLLGTQFGIKLGETVVVGTSRLDGQDEALIVLVKAMP